MNGCDASLVLRLRTGLVSEEERHADEALFLYVLAAQQTCPTCGICQVLGDSGRRLQHHSGKSFHRLVKLRPNVTRTMEAYTCSLTCSFKAARARPVFVHFHLSQLRD